MKRLALLLFSVLLLATPLGQRCRPGTPQAAAQDFGQTEDGTAYGLTPSDAGAPQNQLPPPGVSSGAYPSQDQSPPPETGAPPSAPPPDASGPPSAFYDQLAPYGQWMWLPDFGWVWRPSSAVVGSDFRPYATGGQWVYTSDGWQFDSTYPFGWATYHYGRWYLDSSSGWVWLPGSTWGPAWVDWRYGDGYVGWAPLGPIGFSFSIGFDFSPWWCFVPTPFFTSPFVVTHVVPVTQVQRVFPVTHPVHNVTMVHGVPFHHGPPATVVRQAGAPVQVHPSVRGPVVATPHVSGVQQGATAFGRRPTPPQFRSGQVQPLNPTPRSIPPVTPGEMRSLAPSVTPRVAPTTPMHVAPAPAAPMHVAPMAPAAPMHVAPAPAPMHVAPAPMHSFGGGGMHSFGGGGAHFGGAPHH